MTTLKEARDIAVKAALDAQKIMVDAGEAVSEEQIKAVEDASAAVKAIDEKVARTKGVRETIAALGGIGVREDDYDTGDDSGVL